MDARRKAVPAPRLTNAEIVAKSMEIIGKENGIPKAAPSDIDSELFWMREACVNIARIRARFSKKHKRAIKTSPPRCARRCVICQRTFGR